MKKKFLIAVILLSQVNLIYAHVGNSNTTLEGMAGPYHVLVNIKVPDVVPGTATLTLFTSNDPGIKIYARPVYFYSGENDAPKPDMLTPVAKSPGQYEGIIWMMNNGSASIELTISGPLGEGKMLIPVVTISVTEQKMPASTSYMLIGLGIFLFILMITIVGASVSDGITKSGEPVASGSRRAKVIGFTIATILCSVFVYGGNAWWKSVEKKTRQFVFRPMHATYELDEKNGVNQLHLTIDTVNAQRSQWLPYVIPDHGKIMHLFLVSLPGMDVFAHVHPVREGPISFATNLPNLPQGKYLAFADIVYNSGFTETIKDTITIDNHPPANAKSDSVASDPDDALGISQPIKPLNASLQPIKNSTIGGHTGEAEKLPDGTTILLEGPKNDKNYQSDQLYSLEFSVWDKNNQPLVPDLYMGMAGHAIIVRIDGLVFSHIHPVGTYSMAAQSSMLDRISLSGNQYQDPNKTHFLDSIDQVVKMLQQMPEKEREDYLMKEMKMPSGSAAAAKSNSGMAGMDMSGNNMASMGGSSQNGSMMGMGMPSDNKVSFPYSFPSPGRYRIWVQIKKNGQIYTGVFDRDVK